MNKACGLERKEFSTDFNPYDCGIVDAVAQALLPGIEGISDLQDSVLGDNNSPEY